MIKISGKHEKLKKKRENKFMKHGQGLRYFCESDQCMDFQANYCSNTFTVVWIRWIKG